MTRRVAELPTGHSPSHGPSHGRIFPTGLGIAIDNGTTATPPADNVESAKKKRFYTIVRADLLIPGAGEPVADGAIVIEDRIIAWVGKQHDLPEKYVSACRRDVKVPYLMPGLWDVHAHFMAESADQGANYVGFIAEHPASVGARLAKGCWESLQRGYTSLRDVAGFGCEVSRAVDEGTIPGPNIYSSGACLSQTAGHGDVFPLPAGDVLLNLGVSTVTPGHFGTGVSMLVDGVEECRKGVRLQIRRGAKVIKVLASGGVLSRDDNPLYAQFSDAELECIVQEANRQGRAVAAHVHGKPGILAAVKAGVTSVEHVSFADEECIQLIKERGTLYVATRTVIDLLMGTGGRGIPPESWKKAQLVSADHLAAYKLAIKSGIPIALGTDTAPGFNMALELELAVKCGMTNLEAIKAATANGPLSVGPQAPKTGQLKEGYEADVIAVAENPVEDVRVLQKHKNITWVWKGGKLFKGPDVGPWGEDYKLWDDFEWV
ncbi:amidohydrolase [Podospora aff. communis PSN243]|uniref:Amidohydrolase n=1 Tax=Podospora aff. communis PSN243 TaxID=3040156 RepID=A0AAV9GQ16_9PEZI|nr:amidohydrolase [Podospora aff. communis PSN243]